MIAMLSLLACSFGSVTLDEQGDGTGPSNDDSGEEEETVHPFSGDYEGTVIIESEDYEYDYCTGEATFTVDEDEGSFEASMLCSSEWGGSEIPVDVVGQVDEDGTISGEVVFEMSWGSDEPYESSLEGEADDGDFEAAWETEMDWGNYGTSTFVGTIEAELD
ncbi:MAG TPA: hypothetical protein QGF58_16470 [Myxococcota bacterium]|nr:hypothetical protein [Myxococcota bacterium]